MESPLSDTWFVVVLMLAYLAFSGWLWFSLGAAANAARPVAEHWLDQAMVNAFLNGWR